MVIMDTTESVGTLEEQAHKRKERLKNLKRKNPSGDSSLNDEPVDIVPLPKPKFRSYKPQDESLKEAKLDDAEPAAVEDEVKELIEAGKEKHKGMPLKKAEVMRLLNLVERNPIVYTRTFNATSNKLKDAAWVKITKRFNSGIKTHPRKPEQLRLKWANLKKNARKRSFNINQLKNGIEIPDYIEPDEILDRVAAILGPNCESYSKQFEDEDDTVIVIPSPNEEEEEIAAPIHCVEVGVSDDTEGCAPGIGLDLTSTPKEPTADNKKVLSSGSSGKLIHPNLVAQEIESRINRNNAIADYYTAKRKKLEEEFSLKRDKLLLEKKEIELEILDKEKSNESVDRDKLLLEKKKVDLEILEMKKKKYSELAAFFRASSDSI